MKTLEQLKAEVDAEWTAASKKHIISTVEQTIDAEAQARFDAQFGDLGLNPNAKPAFNATDCAAGRGPESDEGRQSLQSAEAALDRLHEKAVDEGLAELERLERCAAPGPWKLKEGDEGVWTEQGAHLYRVLLREPCNRNFIIALRNVAPKLIFQAKNLTGIVSDLDEVHAALGTDYNQDAGPDVRRLKSQIETLRELRDYDAVSIGELRERVCKNDEQAKAIEELSRDRDRLQNKFSALWKTVKDLEEQRVKDVETTREAIAGKLIAEEKCANLRVRIKGLWEDKIKTQNELQSLRERERQLLSSLASVRRENINLCVSSQERWDKNQDLKRELFKANGEVTRLNKLIDIYKTTWQPKPSTSPAPAATVSEGELL